MQEHFEQFAALISGIHGNIKKLKTAYMDELGLKEVHIFWIYLLYAHPDGMTASELAAAGKSSRSLVSRELKGLIDRGLVYTKEDTERRRYGWKLYLSDEGKALAQRISQVAARVQGNVSAGIPAEELRIFYKTLQILSERFDRLAALKGEADERKNSV